MTKFHQERKLWTTVSLLVEVLLTVTLELYPEKKSEEIITFNA